MNDVFIIFKLLILPVFIILAIFRVAFNNSSMIDFINLGACMISIIIVITTAQSNYDRNSKEYAKLLTLQIINMVTFVVLIVLQYEFHFISLAWSDFISILALGISLSTDTISNIFIAYFKWRKANNYDNNHGIGL